MARQKREKGESHFYHVMVRGVAQQMLFIDEEDNERFLSTVHRFAKKDGVVIRAYCLMGNHAHIIVYDPFDNISNFMKRVGVSFAHYFNVKYERSGHVFQDRFKSVVIYDDKQFVTVLRYVHNNPVKAGLAKRTYKWSSYNEHIGRVKKRKICDVGFALALFGDDVGDFIKFSATGLEDVCPDMKEKVRFSDKRALEIIKEMCNVKSGFDIGKFDFVKRKKCVEKLLGEGLSMVQVSRLTGLSKGMVKRMV